MARIRFLAASIVVVFVLFAGVRSQEVEDETEFQYIKGPKGPSNWGNLKEEWKACGTGKQQSPIDVVKENAQLRPTLGLLRRRYKPSNATLANRGHDIELKWTSGGGWILIEGKNFTLKQMHWHSPSEHSINGKRYAMEAHLVHQSEDEKIAVIGILYKYGRDDSFLKELEDDIRALVEKEEQESDRNSSHAVLLDTELGPVNAMQVKFGSRKYYRYIGSLTTPPCTEGVIWTILRKVRTVGREQVRLYRQAVHDGFENNARTTQPINGRTVSGYKPTPKGDGKP